MLFEAYPEFVNCDSRSQRAISPVTAESLTVRHEAALPKAIINGRSILDLGSCYGATGHWCLSNGASHYTGVEAQASMADKSTELLSKYWTNFDIIKGDIEDFLDDAIATNKKFDVTVVFGVLYAFIDQYGILSKISKVTNRIIVVDSVYPRRMLSSFTSIIEVVKRQNINSTDKNTAFFGAGAKSSPTALMIMLNTLGFKKAEDIIHPRPLKDRTTHDSYNTIVDRPGSEPACKKLPMRFIMRFIKSNYKMLKVSDVVKTDNKSMMRSATYAFTDTAVPSWEFNAEVAARYKDEVKNHIPDYDRVLQLTTACIIQNFSQHAKIIDVGSADGTTVDKLLVAGYKNTYGVECSKPMFDISKHQDRITLSDKLPEGEWDVVIANWVLHFIKEKEQYLQNIFDNMSDDGMLILTDKMSFSNDIEKMYESFKRSNGISDDYIEMKKQALVGVMDNTTCKWYLETLEHIGFRDVQIINANMMFNTLYARK